MITTGINATDAVNALMGTSQAQKTTQSQEIVELEDSFGLSSETEKFRDIVKNYDITSMTHKEMCAMCNELYENGLVDLKDTLTLTLDYDRLIEKMAEKTGYPVSDISVGGRTYQGGGDSKINFIKYLTDAIERSQKMGLEGPVKDLAFVEKVQYYQNS